MAPLGGLYAPVTDEQAAEVVAHAWGLGIRYYDAAPLYGYGLAEQRLGRMLTTRNRPEFVISTKVGRLLYPLDQVLAHPEWDRDWQRLGSVTSVGPDETARPRISMTGITGASPTSARSTTTATTASCGLSSRA